MQNVEDLKILIVEDKKDARMIMRQMLGELGVTQIFEAQDGKEALEFMDAAFDFVDLIICDWNMPNMDGVEFLRQVRSVGIEIPFLMTTGRGDKSSVIEAKSSGVSGYICKPYSIAQLEVKLRVLCQRMAA